MRVALFYIERQSKDRQMSRGQGVDLKTKTTNWRNSSVVDPWPHCYSASHTQSVLATCYPLCKVWHYLRHLLRLKHFPCTPFLMKFIRLALTSKEWMDHFNVFLMARCLIKSLHRFNFLNNFLILVLSVTAQSHRVSCLHDSVNKF